MDGFFVIGVNGFSSLPSEGIGFGIVLLSARRCLQCHCDRMESRGAGGQQSGSNQAACGVESERPRER